MDLCGSIYVVRMYAGSVLSICNRVIWVVYRQCIGSKYVECIVS